jgi:sulfopyruvate decarboxylase subunit alpha
MSATDVASRNAERIVGALVRAGVTIAASLPDSWLSAVIERVSSEPGIRHVRVTREDDGVGICAGAALGGRRAVLVCQNAGVLLSANALAGYGHHHQLPFLVLAVYRGSYEDRFYYQMYKGLVTEPVLTGLQLPFHVMERIDQVGMVEDAVHEAQLARRPVVLLVRRAALLGDGPRAS